MSAIPLVDPILVPASALRDFAADLLLACGVREDDARLVARYLVDVDLRGIDSHGTRLLRRYVGEYRDGGINPAPSIRVLRDAGSVTRFDGDGGAGYLVATRAAQAATAKAATHGIAVSATCNHGHVGSAGIYARLAAAEGFVSWCVAGGAGWGLRDTDRTVWDAMKAPPMCFGVPSAREPHLILDTNANLFGSVDRAEAAIAAGFAHSVFASLGMRFVSTFLGGLLAGACLEGESSQKWPAATRGFLFVALSPDAVSDAASFGPEVARVMSESLGLAPMKGLGSADLPGTLEWKREQERARNGIPVGRDHREILAALAEPLGLAPPW